MSERRQLGTILLESDRITRADVERVLEYQREHGGFFGQALVALGVVSREEIDWALASQHDLPFIFPNADAVDRETARMVPADWALAHLAVPIVRAGRTVTVVAADPLGPDVIEELRSRTGCEIEMALASASRIRDLIHAVYAAPTHRIADEVPIALTELIADAIEHGADRFGVSIRGDAAAGWWRTRADTYRAVLLDGWHDALASVMVPSPLEQLREDDTARVKWRATLKRTGSDVHLDAEAMGGAGGTELIFRPRTTTGVAPVASIVTLPNSLIAELRLLWRGGAARVGVSSAEIEAARAVLPNLPALALGQHVRAAHISVSGDADGAYTLRAERNVAFADAVTAYELDAVTIDLPAEGYPVRELLRAAPLSFMLLDEPEEQAAPDDRGLNWILTILGRPGSHAWDLRALHR